MSKLDRQETRQPVRIPVASSRAPLEVKGLDQKNFSNRWVSDVDDRLSAFLEGGYEFVTRGMLTQAGERTVDSSSGLDSKITKSGGRGMKLHLMRIPIEFYNKDQAVKAREIDEVEKSMNAPSKGTYGTAKIESEISEFK